MNKKETRILISAGHGGRDSGAVCDEWQEANFCQLMRNIVKYYLETYGYNVITDGSWNENLPLKNAIKIAKSVDLAIEFHLNAFSKASARGIEVLANPEDIRISQDLAGAINRITGIPLRGDKGYKPENSGQHTRLGFVRAGGIIVESGFITNPEDMKLLSNTIWWTCRELAKAIDNHITRRKVLGLGI